MRLQTQMQKDAASIIVQAGSCEPKSCVAAQAGLCPGHCEIRSGTMISSMSSNTQAQMEKTLTPVTPLGPRELDRQVLGTTTAEQNSRYCNVDKIYTGLAKMKIFQPAAVPEKARARSLH